MQGLADGYFVLPYTMQNYLADQIQVKRFSTDAPEFVEAEKAVNDKIAKLMAIKGKRSVDSIHKELGHVMWEYVGMARTKQSLETAIEKLKEVINLCSILISKCRNTVLHSTECQVL